jgi:hypothetical protein
MSTDVLVVQFASAGLVASGLLCVVSATTLFPSRVSIGEVTRKNPVPWSPRDLGGGGSSGKSPIFGLMWFIIFTTQFAFAVAALVNALQQHEVRDPVSLFNQSACVAGALLMASLWSPLFVEERNWTFVLASILLVVTSVMTTTAAVVSKPFFVNEWFTIFGGISTTFFAGWTSIAAGLSTGIVTRIHNRGMNAPESKYTTGTTSYFPLVLALFAAILAIVFANPIFPVPLLLTLPFVPGLLNDWRIWVPAIVCVIGIAGGVVTLFVYRESGYPF